ncbi:TlpA family protein disulfide reductase [Nocardioides sp.]|uniref:TlpA family protein disulfide reductase n=1 Tax=Nocardioides sp. TaxID=35761 RepID=UPI0039E5FA59
MTGLWVALAAVLVALAFGGYRAVVDGRFRGRHRVCGAAPVEVPQETTWDQLAEAVREAEPGERATLVQFSTAFCAPCRATRRVLADVAEATAGVRHVEVDAEHHLDVVRRLGIVRTPTTIVLDATGREIARAAGLPRREQVVSALALIE